MTKDVLSLPRLLRGEELTGCVPWESRTILSWGRGGTGPKPRVPVPTVPQHNGRPLDLVAGAGSCLPGFQACLSLPPWRTRPGFLTCFASPRTPGLPLGTDPLVRVSLPGRFRVERKSVGYLA